MNRSESKKEHWKIMKESGQYSLVCQNMSKSKIGKVSPFKGKSRPTLIGNKNAAGHTPWNKCKPMSEETRQKVIAAKSARPTRYWLGKKRPNFIKNVPQFDRTGQDPWNKGRECPQLSKENHWNWQDGASADKHDFYFKSVLSPMLREKYDCFVCHTKEDLLVHHVDLNKHNNNLRNLAVMCRHHHGVIHHIIERIYNG